MFEKKANLDFISGPKYGYLRIVMETLGVA